MDSPFVPAFPLVNILEFTFHTLDPSTGRRLWSSDQESAGGSIGGIHWESPMVVNGRLYISDESGAMTAYGLTDDRDQ
jgi:hypothetical protein